MQNNRDENETSHLHLSPPSWFEYRTACSERGNHEGSRRESFSKTGWQNWSLRQKLWSPEVLRAELKNSGTALTRTSPPSVAFVATWWQQLLLQETMLSHQHVQSLTSLLVIKNTHFICLRLPAGTSMFKVKVVNVILHRYNRKSKTFVYSITQMRRWVGTNCATYFHLFSFSLLKW